MTVEKPLLRKTPEHVWLPPLKRSAARVEGVRVTPGQMLRNAVIARAGGRAEIGGVDGPEARVTDAAEGPIAPGEPPLPSGEGALLVVRGGGAHYVGGLVMTPRVARNRAEGRRRAVLAPLLPSTRFWRLRIHPTQCVTFPR